MFRRDTRPSPTRWFHSPIALRDCEVRLTICNARSGLNHFRQVRHWHLPIPYEAESGADVMRKKFCKQVLTTRSDLFKYLLVPKCHCPLDSACLTGCCLAERWAVREDVLHCQPCGRRTIMKTQSVFVSWTSTKRIERVKEVNGLN